jgi:hypothetical protein
MRDDIETFEIWFTNNYQEFDGDFISLLRKAFYAGVENGKKSVVNEM